MQPGIVLDRLREKAEEHGLTFAPDPATHRWCTVGGMIGNNSCGVHSVMAGKTDDNIDELEILTYDGLRMRVGATPPDELEAIIREGGRRGEIYAGAARLRDRYARPRPCAFPEDPAPRVGLQPRLPAARERLPRRARAGGIRGDLRHDPRGHDAARAEPAVPLAAGAGVRRRLSGGRCGAAW